ncbi:hypothetical protein [Streptomyces asiaticus]
MPKLPPPLPRSAQNRSGSLSREQVTIRPSTRTTSADTNWSQAMPGNIHQAKLEGLDTAARSGKHGGRPPVVTDDVLHTGLRRRVHDESVAEGSFDQREDEGVDDLVDRLVGLHRPAEAGAALLVDGGAGPVRIQASTGHRGP